MTDQRPELTDDDQHLNDVFLDGLWERFFITNNPADLAVFVRNSGDIDDQRTRDIIADLLDTAPHKNPGGAKHRENIDFYLAVRGMMRGDDKDAIIEDAIPLITNPLITNPLITNPPKKHRAPVKQLGKTAAIKCAAEIAGISEPAGWDTVQGA